MKKRALALICCFALLIGIAAGCGNGESTNGEAESTKLVVGATAKPHAEILEVVKPMLEEEGIDLEIKEFTDYILLNPALNDGEIDANFFQHIPYLEEYNEKNGTELVWTVKVHNEPMGVYSDEYEKLEDLPDGATVGIPNDTTNGGRALMVLQSAGIIKVNEEVGLALKKIYAEELGTEEARQLAKAVYDYSEYLEQYSSRLQSLVHPLKDRAAYHLPCHTQAQGTGLPGLQLMRLIPGLELDVVEDCCGQSGTYGFKAEKNGVSRAISSSLVRRIAAVDPNIVLTPCGSCKDRISFASGVKTEHPVQLLRRCLSPE
jgi:D-methionine transport system substrate-binding protein